MTQVATVYLKGNWAPGGKDFISGFITQYDPSKVLVYDREDYRGSCVEFPTDNVARIEHGTGWR